MGSHGDTLAYLEEINPKVRPLAAALHEILTNKLGCDSYVKTIYAGYAIEGEMVAALYGHGDHVEVALALPEDFDHEILQDASHLTWRTLPLAAIVRRRSDLADFETLASTACSRVRSAAHDVNRDNDFFIKSRRDRRRPRST